MLHPAFAVGGAVANHPGVAAVVLEVAVVVVDADHQAPRRGVQLLQEGAQVVDPFRVGIDDKLVLEGAHRAVLADKRLCGGE
ncbi:hypothetical protein D3C78_1440320 [compost metagenome]